jgi:hypothetical protein
MRLALVSLLLTTTRAQPQLWRDLKERNERFARKPIRPTRQTRGQARITPRKPQLPHLTYRKHELDYATHHAYVDFEHKLLYCAIPKVACTEFFRLFHRMADSKKKCTTVGQCANQMTERQRNRWKGDPHFRPDKPILNKVASPEEATHAMNDRNFTKFVFFRDPAERLLSAYLDKFEHGSRYRVGYGLRIFKDPKMNFSGFVERIERVNKRRSNPDGLHPHTNPHWRPQRFMCNLEKFLPLYTFVGSFTHLREHTELMLRQANLWEEFGARGWPLKAPGGSGKVPARGPTGSMFQKNTAWHADGTSSKTEQYYTPELLERVKKAYAMDYEMLESINALGSEPTTGAAWSADLNAKQKLWHFDRGFLDDQLKPPESRCPDAPYSC